MTYGEALMCVQTSYIQRAEWGTRHLALMATAPSGHLISEYRHCYNEHAPWPDRETDVAADDWRTMSIQETQPQVIGSDWCMPMPIGTTVNTSTDYRTLFSSGVKARMEKQCHYCPEKITSATTLRSKNLTENPGSKVLR